MRGQESSREEELGVGGTALLRLSSAIFEVINVRPDDFRLQRLREGSPPPLPLFFLELLDFSEDAPRREGCDAQVARLRRRSQAADDGRVQEHSPISKPYVWLQA